MRFLAGCVAGLGLICAIVGLAFFHPEAGVAGQPLADTLRPDLRLFGSLAVLGLLAVVSGARLGAIKEASSYLLTLLVLILAGGAALAGLAHLMAFEALHREAGWVGRTWDNLLGVVPGTLSSLVGASSLDEGAVRLAGGAARGLGNTLVDAVRYPGFEAIPDNILTLLVFLPLPAGLVVYVVGVGPKVAARFHAGQPLWLRLAAQLCLFAMVYLALSAVYLNILVRQSVNFAGSLSG